jgi:AraC-like DNA-binding protein
MLSDRSDGRTISSIAEEWSFTDPSAYSRMFRKEIGISRREAREKGRKNLTRPIEPDVRERIDRPLTLGNLLLSHN